MVFPISMVVQQLPNRAVPKPLAPESEKLANLLQRELAQQPIEALRQRQALVAIGQPLSSHACAALEILGLISLERLGARGAPGSS